ncbi:glycine/D-amino acid oxidase-like deaminating enzyme [Hoeflea marina]|uniref:Glycine/D-amino acid oxidase-like deaminating enzyme n=1 Tax=Hoeflea marina TaxID=274592 RepID=A0A317PMF2_9HYPH|nr:FAD-binding oxidoreductase [Hoeflea marina]PWW01937.1 glycine/D-amino acid oxidase-like deaminating enzyme [Hoeflea marina]
MTSPVEAPRIRSGAGGADTIVVGAGIAGICAALDLQRRGARVTLVDAAEPGSGASFGNAGIIVNTNLRPVFAGMTPLTLVQMLRNPSSPLNVFWHRFPMMAPWFLRMLRNSGAQEVARITEALGSLARPGAGHYRELLQQAGAEDLVAADGNVALMRSEAELEAQWDRMSAIRQAGVRLEKVSGRDLRDLVPSVSAEYSHGLYSPAFQHALDPQGMIGRLADLFRARGGVWRNEKVLSVTCAGGQATGVMTPSGRISAGSVVLAAGTESARFAARMGEKVPHQAVGGYHVMLRNCGVTLARPILPMDFRFAVTPMRGAIRLAGIYEFGGEGRRFRADRLERMLAHIGKVLPGIRTDDTRVWRGFRSYLPDGLPIISQSASTEGLFYMFGFSSSGMINGPTAGRAMAALVMGEDPEIDVSPFAVSRF